MSSDSGRFFLLPVDASENSKRALDYYAKNMYRSGDKVGLVHVHETPSLPPSYVMMGPMVMPSDWNEELQKSVQASKDTIETFKKECEKRSIPCEIHMPESQYGAGAAICSLAKDKNADGIVMGSRGLNLLRRTLLGSVSSYVVNHAHVPVTVTPPKEEV